MQTPSEKGVKITEYPEVVFVNPESEPPEIDMSEASKLFVDSEIEKLSSTELLFVNEPLSTSEEVIEIAGEVPSYVQKNGAEIKFEFPA